MTRAWHQNPENVLPFVSDAARDRFERTIGDPDGGGDDEEPELIDRFEVTLEQLHWRRFIRELASDPDCPRSFDELIAASANVVARQRSANGAAVDAQRVDD